MEALLKQAERESDGDPARLHASAAGTAGAAGPSSAGLFRDVLARFRADLAGAGRRAGHAAGRRSAGGRQLSHKPGADGRGARFRPARAQLAWTMSPTGTSPSTIWTRPPTLSMHLSRLAAELILWSQRRVRLRRDLRRLHFRLQHHAAEEERRRLRADPGAGGARWRPTYQGLTSAADRPAAGI